MIQTDSSIAFSKDASGWQLVPQGCPSSQTEKKSIKNISNNPKRKEVNNKKSEYPNRTETNSEHVQKSK